MADYGASDTSTTTLGANQFPISEVYVPSTGLKALGGGPVQNDGSKDYAPALMYIPDGNDVTLGAKTNTAATDSTSSWSVIALLKGLYAKLAGTLTVAGAVTTSGTVTEANSASMLTALQTLVTDNADVLADGDNLTTMNTSLTTLAGVVSSSKAAVKAASGDYADGAIVGIGTTTQTKATDATTTSWSVVQLLKGIFNSLLNTLTVQGGTLVVTGTVTANGQDLIAATDVSAYKELSIQITGTWSGTISWQCSNDNTNWTACYFTNVGNASSLNSSTTINQIYYAPVNFKYFRAHATAWTSGTATGTMVASLMTSVMPLTNANLFDNNGNPISVAQQNMAGSLSICVASDQTALPTKGPTANAAQTAGGSNTVVKASSGWLWSVVVTTLGTAALSIFDNATTNSGRVLLTIPASAAVGTIYSFPGGAFAANGITSGGVASCPGVTFQYA
jgi:filamentous hemagglutinin